MKMSITEFKAQNYVSDQLGYNYIHYHRKHRKF